MLLPGDAAPYFQIASSVNPRFNIDTVAGRYIVMSFFASTQMPAAKRLLDAIALRRDRFDVTNTIFFGVTTDPADVQRLRHEDGGRIYFFDLDLKASAKYGLVHEPSDASRTTDPASSRNLRYTPTTFILDQAMRVLAVLPLTEDTTQHVESIFAVLDAQPALSTLTHLAPVMTVPNVFEPELCRELIDYYEARGGEESGFMRDVNGKTVGIMDHHHKRRLDCEIVDDEVIRATHERLSRRVIPAIRQAYQFNVTRIERHIVACYDAAQGAHFRAHRDNTTLGTAHRRFAVTMNLNAEDYDGAELWFPEFGPQRFKGPTGSATIFSCSLLHEVVPVRRGKRYAFLPFLYDEAAKAIRERNRLHLGDLSGAGGGNVPGACNATPTRTPTPAPTSTPTQATPSAQQSASTKPTLDGICGCGNPNGCGTCLSAATYPIGTPTKTPR